MLDKRYACSLEVSAAQALYQVFVIGDDLLGIFIAGLLAP